MKSYPVERFIRECFNIYFILVYFLMITFLRQQENQKRGCCQSETKGYMILNLKSSDKVDDNLFEISYE